jgi:glutamate-ammonia-ligase adenylyltransferase
VTVEPSTQRLLERLPDPEPARRLLARLETECPSQLAALKRRPAQFANVLTLAAYSPWLADFLAGDAETIDWLVRLKNLGRGFTKEDFLEELARFGLRHATVPEPDMLASFKMRELIRIYLRDCLRIATLTETAEEISHLADAILERALAHVRQSLVNRYGSPQCADEHGRLHEAEFAVVALGKLGSLELNYSSDIDLMFLYSGAGHTTFSTGEQRGESIDNHTFFTRLAEVLVKTVGSPGRTAPVYRVDLRLRPYGRDGDLALRFDRSVEYYRTVAQPWERQMLIRARAAAGSEQLVSRFLAEVHPIVFRPEPAPDALAAVAASREKIDRDERRRTGGFDVKLGTGGIREVEFIVQALQLTHGGQDPWLRAPRVLIGLQRLADKGYLTDAERSTLSEAYVLLRTVEHRLQMAHGVQTHRMPADPEGMTLLARRCGYDPASGAPGEALAADVGRLTRAVRAIYERVVPGSRSLAPARAAETEAGVRRLISRTALAAQPLDSTARLLGSLCGDSGDEQIAGSRALLADLASRLRHPVRALRNLERYLASLATSDVPRPITELATSPEALEQLARLLGSGAWLADMLVNRPALVTAIPGPLFCTTLTPRETMASHIAAALAGTHGLGARMAALRQAWYREALLVGCHDVLGRVPLPLLVRELTDLAETTLDAAIGIALDELVPTWRAGWEGRYCLMSFGRLAHASMDFGSDLDLLVLYDPHVSLTAPWHANRLYMRLTELLVQILSSMTRDGFIYRVDLRLRPEGRAGRPAATLTRLEEYLTTRASPWELTVYLRARPALETGGFGEQARRCVLRAVFAARGRHPDLRGDLSRMRAGLERTHGRAGVNIKWGPGGMMDVYFVARYLQLANEIDFPPERGTIALLWHLAERGHLSGDAAHTLAAGYERLRTLDHGLRLLGEAASPRLPEEADLREELAEMANYADVTSMERDVHERLSSIRGVFKATFESE